MQCKALGINSKVPKKLMKSIQALGLTACIINLQPVSGEGGGGEGGGGGRLERPGESPEKFFNEFSLVFIEFSFILIDFGWS